MGNDVKPLSANPTWPDTQSIRLQEPTNCLSMFDHFVELALKGLSTRTFRKN